MIEVSEEFIELLLALTTNIAGLCLLGILVVYAWKTFSIKNESNRYLYILFGVSFVELLTHLFTTVAQYYGFYGSNLLGRVLYSLVYVINSGFLIAWILYLNEHISKTVVVGKTYIRRLYILSVPVLLLLVLSLLNMVTPVFFSYQDFDYQRLPTYHLTLLIPVGYLIYGIYLFMKSKHRRRIYQQLPFVALLLPIVVAHTLEWCFIELCCIPLANTMTLLILVLTSVRQHASVDGMTGLYTRRELYHYLEHAIGGSRRLTGVMMDLDHFKSINDTYGHLVGDDALSDFGYLIRSGIPHGAIGYRYAGDEFIVLMPGMDQDGAEHFVRQFAENMKRFNERSDNVYELQSSFGVSMLEDADTANSFIERMDKKMYENKISKR